MQQEIAGIYELEGDVPSAAKVYDGMVDRLVQHEPGYAQMPAARILYEAGQIHARLGEQEVALARFDEASKLPGDDIYVYRAALASADLCMKLDRRSEALRKYRRIADAIPNTDEGKAAKRALKKFQDRKS